jgi:hypothetical protein
LALPFLWIGKEKINDIREVASQPLILLTKEGFSLNSYCFFASSRRKTAALNEHVTFTDEVLRTGNQAVLMTWCGSKGLKLANQQSKKELLRVGLISAHTNV